MARSIGMCSRTDRQENKWAVKQTLATQPRDTGRKPSIQAYTSVTHTHIYNYLFIYPSTYSCEYSYHAQTSATSKEGLWVLGVCSWCFLATNSFAETCKAVVRSLLYKHFLLQNVAVLGFSIHRPLSSSFLWLIFRIL